MMFNNDSGHFEFPELKKKGGNGELITYTGS